MMFSCKYCGDFEGFLGFFSRNVADCICVKYVKDLFALVEKILKSLIVCGALKYPFVIVLVQLVIALIKIFHIKLNNLRF